MAETCTQTNCFNGQSAVETMKAAFLAAPQEIKTRFSGPVKIVYDMEKQLRAAAAKPPAGYCCAWQRLGDAAVKARAAIINAAVATDTAPRLPGQIPAMAVPLAPPEEPTEGWGLGDWLMVAGGLAIIGGIIYVGMRPGRIGSGGYFSVGRSRPRRRSR